MCEGSTSHGQRQRRQRQRRRELPSCGGWRDRHRYRCRHTGRVVGDAAATIASASEHLVSKSRVTSGEHILQAKPAPSERVQVQKRERESESFVATCNLQLASLTRRQRRHSSANSNTIGHSYPITLSPSVGAWRKRLRRRQVFVELHLAC